MPECKLLETCPFFNDKMPIDSGMGAMYKKKYCENDNTSCARYMVVEALGREKTPVDLFPNMIDRAEETIKAG